METNGETNFYRLSKTHPCVETLQAHLRPQMSQKSKKKSIVYPELQGVYKLSVGQIVTIKMAIYFGAEQLTEQRVYLEIHSALV